VDWTFRVQVSFVLSSFVCFLKVIFYLQTYFLRYFLQSNSSSTKGCKDFSNHSRISRRREKHI
jgi:hypothetical protein